MSSARIRRGPAVPAALAVLCLLAPIAAAPQTRPANPELSALVPKLAAWSLSEAPRSYFPDNLFEYIDGAAESYLSYDFRELLVADLVRKGTDATMTLEIYDMGLPLNAFGIFGAERYPENKVVALGDLGYVEGEALNFLSGRFYVKMLAFGLGEATESTLGEIGAKIAGAIKAGGGLPALVRAFPKDNLVSRSEKYIKKNFMGYEFLHDGYVATYKPGGRELEGFFIDGGSDKAAEEMLTKLLAALAADNQSVEKLALGFHARNRYGQHLYIGRVRSVLCGAMRVPDGLEAAGESLLRATAAALAEKRAPK
ncbi:MAG: DUF6599 family protein [Candidatus Aminicenantales bacterium]